MINTIFNKTHYRPLAFLSLLLFLSAAKATTSAAKAIDDNEKPTAETTLTGEQISRDLFFYRGNDSNMFAEFNKDMGMDLVRPLALSEKYQRAEAMVIRNINAQYPNFFATFGQAMQSSDRVLIKRSLKHAITVLSDVKLAQNNKLQTGSLGKYKRSRHDLNLVTVPAPVIGPAPIRAVAYYPTRATIGVESGVIYNNRITALSAFTQLQAEALINYVAVNLDE